MAAFLRLMPASTAAGCRASQFLLFILLFLTAVPTGARAQQCIRIDRLPYAVKAPGYYCLDRSLNSDGNADAIEVSADDVIIDLRGFCLLAAGDKHSQAIGIDIHGGHDVTIRNGCIEGFLVGVQARRESAAANGTPRVSDGTAIRELRLNRNTFRGIVIDGDRSRIDDNIVTNTGGTEVYEDSYAFGIEIRGNDCVVRRNVVQETYGVGTGEGAGISLSEKGQGCLIQGNFVANSRIPDPGRTFGIWSGPTEGETPVFDGNRIVTMTYAVGYVGVLLNNTFIGVPCGPLYGKPSDRHISDHHSVVVPDESPVDPHLPAVAESCPDRPAHFMPAAMKGDLAAMFRLGEIYGMEEHWEKAWSWYELAARFGSGDAARPRDEIGTRYLSQPEKRAALAAADKIAASIRSKSRLARTEH